MTLSLAPRQFAARGSLWPLAPLLPVGIAGARGRAGLHPLFGYQPLIKPVAIATLIPLFLAGVPAAAHRRIPIAAYQVISAGLWLLSASVVLFAGTTGSALSGAAFSAAGKGAVNGWAQLLNITLPAPPRPELLVVPFTLTWIAVAVGAELALRARVVLAPMLPPLVAFIIALAFLCPVRDRTHPRRSPHPVRVAAVPLRGPGPVLAPPRQHLRSPGRDSWDGLEPGYLPWTAFPCRSRRDRCHASDNRASDRRRTRCLVPKDRRRSAPVLVGTGQAGCPAQSVEPGRGLAGRAWPVLVPSPARHGRELANRCPRPVRRPAVDVICPVHPGRPRGAVAVGRATRAAGQDRPSGRRPQRGSHPHGWPPG